MQQLLNGNQNKLLSADRAAHDWYRFVLSFPPHLVRDYLARFGVSERATVLDPFCGTGTTLVECKKLGVSSVGIEANTMAFFASMVKTNWRPSPGALKRHAYRVAERALSDLEKQGITDGDFFREDQKVDNKQLYSLPEEQMGLLLKNSISSLPLHKTLVLLSAINEEFSSEFTDHERLALAKVLVSSVGNLHFGPEVGVGRIKADAPVVAPWMEQMDIMAMELETLGPQQDTPARIFHSDARHVTSLIENESVDFVFTSPPYPNEKDYTRTTRLESVLLGFLKNKAQLRSMKQGLIRSNTRNVYITDTDESWVAEHKEVNRIAGEIERRRLELGKTSGFERLYARVAKLYFGGMARHLATLRDTLRPGAMLGYVVGDQASFLRVMIRTGQILASIADSLGYEVVGLDLFRTRMATATREQLREEVLVLKWQGKKK